MKQFINLRLMFFMAISLCLGIGFMGAMKLFSMLSSVIIAASFMFLILLFILFFIKKDGVLATIMFVCTFILFFSLGGILVNVQIDDYEKANLNAHSYQVVARIDDVSPTEYGNKFILSNAYVEGDIKAWLEYKILLYVNGESDFDIGDRISFYAKLNDKPLVYSNRVMSEEIANGIKYSASLSANQITLIESDKTIFQEVNTFIRDSLKSGLDGNEFSIAYAMLLGNSDYMDSQVLTSYRSAGVAHIFAVSGLHIGFLSVALNFVLDRLRAKRWVKALFIIPTLLFYSGVCGFTASSIRASIMATVMLLVSIKGQRYDGLTSISFAAIIILLLNPMEMFCVGFILSFAVVLGIVVLSNPISRLFKFLPEKFAGTLGTVISAQLVGMPISLMFFGEFSTIAIIANLLFIPIVSIVFVFLLLATIIGGAIGISSITLFLLNYVIKGINFLITILDSNALMIGGFSLFGFVVFYYLALIILSGIINLKALTKTILFAICSIICVTGSIFYNVNYNEVVKIYVLGSQKISATFVCEKQSNTLIISDANGAFSLSRIKSISNAKGIKEIDNIFFCSENKDYQAIITRLNSVFDLKTVYYYGKRDENAEKIVCKSFPNIEMINLLEFDDILSNELTFEYIDNGDGVSIERGDINYLILSNTNKLTITNFIEKNEYDKIIALEQIEWLTANFGDQKIISYRKSNFCADAETFGNLSINLE